MPKTRNGFFLWCTGVFLLAITADTTGRFLGWLTTF